MYHKKNITQPPHLKKGDKVALISPAYWVPQEAIQQAAGFPVGSDSCIPLIEGAHCSLDVSTEKAVLTFKGKGTTETYQLEHANQQLMKEII